jgi:hypothetical protein
VRCLRILIFLVGLLLPLLGAVALAWSDRSYGWPQHPGLAILLLWASIAVGGVLLARSFRQGAPFLAFILPATMVLGTAAAATQEWTWLWLRPDSNGVSAAEGADAARTLVGSAIGMGVPLGFLAAHVIVLEQVLSRRLRGAAYANRP